jgi:hypothetical protein
MKRSFSKRRRDWNRQASPPAPLSLNAFPLTFDRPLAIPILLYEVTPTKMGKGQNDSQGSITNALWRHRSAHRDRCSGSGFIVGVDAEVVAVSQNWDLPNGYAEGFNITRKIAITVTDDDRANQRVVLDPTRCN